VASALKKGRRGGESIGTCDKPPGRRPGGPHPPGATSCHLPPGGRKTI